IMERKRGSCALKLQAIKGSTKAAMETKQQGLDVLTSAEGVRRKIGTRAEVFKHAGTPHRHSILPSACRLHHVIAISLSGRLRKNFLNRFPGALLSGGDLFFDDHISFLQDVANRQDRRKYVSEGMGACGKRRSCVMLPPEIRRLSPVAC